MLITKEDIGRKLWDILMQEWVEIEGYMDDCIYCVMLKRRQFNCTSDGKSSMDHNFPHYLWDKVEIKIPDKPNKPRKTKKIKGWIGVKLHNGIIESSDIYRIKPIEPNPYWPKDYKFQEIEVEVWDDIIKEGE